MKHKNLLISQHPNQTELGSNSGKHPEIDQNNTPKKLGDVIPINFESEIPTVRGRDLHNALKVRTKYNDWFPRMCAYGFTQGKDFYPVLKKSTGGRPAMDHVVTIAMAKELCMLQRSEMGRKFRQYFLSVGEAMNTPEKVMERAWHIAQERAAEAQKRILATALTDCKEAHDD